METCRCGTLTATGRTDALRSLLRLMVGNGLTGSAAVYGPEGGHPRLLVKDIEAAARYCLNEGDRSGLVLVKHRPEKTIGAPRLHRHTRTHPRATGKEAPLGM